MESRLMALLFNLRIVAFRLLEEDIIGRILAADATVGQREASALLRRWLLAALAPAGGSAGGDSAAAAAGSSASGGSGRCSTVVGSTVNGALLDARSPEELLLADDRWAPFRFVCC